jgi:hypothetical protein
MPTYDRYSGLSHMRFDRLLCTVFAVFVSTSNSLLASDASASRFAHAHLMDDLGEAQAVLTDGLDPNSQFDLDPNTKFSLLSLSSFLRADRIRDLLLDKGADPVQNDGDAWMAAVGTLDAPTFEAFLSHGAQIQKYTDRLT